MVASPRLSDWCAANGLIRDVFFQSATCLDATTPHSKTQCVFKPSGVQGKVGGVVKQKLSLIHISEPTRLALI
eukprot:4947599-Alexandrium_andersonii.AAC.1